MQQAVSKPIHGAAKQHNVPFDMIDTPPIPCRVAVGDRVIYTNDYGVQFEKRVRGFASVPHGMEFAPQHEPRFVYIDSDAWWFPVEASSVRLMGA